MCMFGPGASPRSNASTGRAPSADGLNFKNFPTSSIPPSFFSRHFHENPTLAPENLQTLYDAMFITLKCVVRDSTLTSTTGGEYITA